MSLDPSAPCIIIYKKKTLDATHLEEIFLVPLRMLLEEVHAPSSDTKPDYRLGRMDIPY